MTLTVRSLEDDLNSQIRGDVRFDTVARAMHATDASHYQIMPQCIVVPIDEDDCVRAVKVAHDHGLAITVRGGATSLSGQTHGPGMVLDVSKYLDKVIEINVEEQWARVQPGVVRDRLNAQLAPFGLHFAPDPATTSRATIGGMIGNNSSGMRSVLYGKTIDHTLECRVALSDGTTLTLDDAPGDEFDRRCELPGREGGLYRGVRDLVDNNRDEIVERFPDIMRRVSGYNLDEFVDGAGYTGPIGPRDNAGPRTPNLTNLVVGSEGTLAVLLEAKVRLMPLPKATALCVVHFRELLDSLRGMPAILEHDVSVVELLDQVVMDEAKVNSSTRDLADFVEGNPAAVHLIEVQGDDAAEAEQKIRVLAADLEAKGIGYAWPIRTDPKGMANVWAVRRLGLGLISNVKGPVKGQAFVEDAAVPVENLPIYIERLMDLCAETDTPVSIYAHASVGVLHSRPMIDLHLPEHQAKMQAIADQAFEWVTELGGVFAGEHGDGMVRGQYIPQFFGAQLYQAFVDLKALFDPDGLMNPGKVIDTPGMTDHLRYGDEYKPDPGEVMFRYDDQGGFVLAVEQCNGVGACRKLDSGTMCPSYMATRDEDATTRGRANALRMAMSGQLGPAGLTSDGVLESLDLCLSCKACKTECPNNVDMAKLKSDVLQRHHDVNGTSPAARLIGSMGQLAARMAGPMAPVANRMQSQEPVRRMLERVAGIDRRRPLPQFARNPFSIPATSNRTTDVVLFVDTWARYYEPEVAHAAVALLRSAGFEPRIIGGDAQRTRISKGLLRAARTHGAKLLAELDATSGPILCLEPSEASALTDDLPDLVDDAVLGRRVADRTDMIDRFLADRLDDGSITGFVLAPGVSSDVLLHGHCHQKALFGTAAMKKIYAAIDGAACTEVDSGCCGMAGSFGYEHYDVSRTIGEDRLFPAVRKAADANQTVVASGVSCRHQIHDFCGVKATHWIETIRIAPANPSPEGA